MNFRDARDLALELGTAGCKVPTFDHTSPVAGCWIDRMEWVQRTSSEPGIHGALRLEDAIKEANRYAGR
jgi:hypothetical protein